ncbi:hypothetical protein Asp14428_20030 [Actinoplanes sp. NBRC 14428]|nr:hypothetical protein Asp14428_20030 [Actinoplanes sp. NBRC 14428]
MFLDGRPIGWQLLRADDYATRREVVTGSWLRPDNRGDGIGTEMRTAVLHLAFHHLEARYATSRATSDNRASLGVSKKLGYEEDGMDVASAGEEALVLRRVRLSADRWRASDPRRSVTVDNYEQCRELFGS